MRAVEVIERRTGRPAPTPNPGRRRGDTLAADVAFDLALTAAWLEGYAVLHRDDPCS